ncbi:hypothetical protein [Vibrio parahaemolyticus]|uniref:hypothetical protein n=1 Tax=Vibrio parahaemolyticus TaxID=670 RepID=UPI001E3232D4|nr:hypothetical protein [Vibrio parahaemolyticus]MCD2148740.1 hypothetical protein [Vibrio parahaemolyticus]HCJ4667674.1 hypothetical protein [Vibrio parahaemolyticus]
MRIAFYTFTLLLSSMASAQSDFYVKTVANGFALNGKQAASILYCAKQSNEDCISFTLNQESLSRLLNDGLIQNKQRDNKDFEVSATFDGANSVISSKVMTGASLKLMKLDEDSQTLSIDYFAQLYRAPDKGFPDGTFLRFDRANLVLSGDSYSALFRLVQLTDSATIGDSSNLSDCELAGKMISDTTPYIEKAISLTDSKKYQDVASWRAKVFNPAISDIEQRYNTREIATQFRNKPISSEVASEYVLRTKLLVQEVYSHVRHGVDKSGIKQQWKLMRVPLETYSNKCESQPTFTASTSSPRKNKSILVKKSNSGICHSPSSSWYGRTNSYTSYDSIDACLKSGGKLPKK